MARKVLNISYRVSYSTKYNDPNLGKLINVIMQDGKKNLAENIVYGALESAAQSLNVEPMEMFNQILDNICCPFVIISRKMGNVNHQIPVSIDREKQLSRAIIRLKKAVKKIHVTKRIPTEKCLQEEFVNAYNKKGLAVKEREEIEQLSIKNKIFAHFSWMKKRVPKKKVSKVTTREVSDNESITSDEDDNSIMSSDD